ncbi:DoxX family protein [Aurantimonas endophytica]|uniref:DoxX family protein n=1 Tax=Aurantimonas endophytica TaxID=1522175 RepID=UPI0016059404|nr:hypothetical protein [Aurantimonas endophytica]
MVEASTHGGFPDEAGPRIAIATLACAALLIIGRFPRSASLGAILATGFFGGAIIALFRVGQVGSPPQLICLALS